MTNPTPPQPVTLTSADRILIARLTDLAIDVTNQGSLVANAAYMGFARSLHVWWQPATGGEMKHIDIALSADTETVRSELTQAIQTLEAMLDLPPSTEQQAPARDPNALDLGLRQGAAISAAIAANHDPMMAEEILRAFGMTDGEAFEGCAEYDIARLISAHIEIPGLHKAWQKARQLERKPEARL